MLIKANTSARANDTKGSHSVEGLTEAAGERAKSCIDASVGAGVNALNAVSGKARELGSTADGYVRSSPWMAIAAAAGSGILVGFLFRSRREC